MMITVDFIANLLRASSGATGEVDSILKDQIPRFQERIQFCGAAGLGGFANGLALILWDVRHGKSGQVLVTLMTSVLGGMLLAFLFGLEFQEGWFGAALRVAGLGSRFSVAGILGVTWYTVLTCFCRVVEALFGSLSNTG